MKSRLGWQRIDSSATKKILEMRDYYWDVIEPVTNGYGDDRILDMFERRFGVRVSHDILMDIAYFEDF